MPLTVDTVLARGLAKHPNSRFEDCEAFGNALAEALAPEMRPSLSTLPDAFHAGPQAQRQPARLLTLALAIVSGAGLMWLGDQILLQPTISGPKTPVVERVEPVIAVERPVAARESVPAVAWLAESPKHIPKHATDDDDSDEAELEGSDGRGGATSDDAPTAASAAPGEDTTPKPGR